LSACLSANAGGEVAGQHGAGLLHRVGRSERRRLQQVHDRGRVQAELAGEGEGFRGGFGEVGEPVVEDQPALHAETEGVDTLLRGAVADQAALYGLLAQLEALGLDLLEVRRLPRDVGPPARP